jgi:hypothetical protein
VAERTLAALRPDSPGTARARFLATIAVESRGARGPEAAREVEGIARGLGDPAVLAFALNGAFMQDLPPRWAGSPAGRRHPHRPRIGVPAACLSVQSSTRPQASAGGSPPLR